MRLSGVIDESIVDGPGIRTTIFMQGCPHHCPKCHNPETHPFDGGFEVDENYIDDIFKRNPHVDGVTLSGGDPLASPKDCLTILKIAKEKYKLNVWLYTGYLFEDMIKDSENNLITKEILGLIDVIVDGPYVDSLRDLSLPYCGSQNQRVIDVKASLKAQRVVIF